MSTGLTPLAPVPAEPPLRRRHAWQWLGLAAALLAVAAFVLIDLLAQRERIGNEQEARLVQQLRLLEQVISREFQAIGAGLATVVDDLPAWAAEGAMAQANRHLAALDSANTGTRIFVLLDENGRIYAASRPEVVGVDASMRDHFRTARADNDARRLYLSSPFRTTLGVWSLNLTRVVQHADGRFAGTVSATLDPNWLNEVLASANFAPDMWAAMTHIGGTLVLMTPTPVAGVEGANLLKPGSMFSRHLEAGADETVFGGRIFVTGQPGRVIAQRTLRPPDLQLQDTVVLALSRDLDAVFAGWQRQAINAAWLLALLTVLTAAGLVVVQRGELRAAAVSERAVRERIAQDERWVMALQSSGLGVWDFDPRSGREYHSPQWKAMLDLQDQPLDDSYEVWRSRLHPDDRARTLHLLDACLAGRTPTYEAEYRLVDGAGNWRWVLSRGRVAERGADGQAHRMIGTILDITDRHEAQAVRAERDRAAAASRAKTEFLSRMSHEMRTPLNAVLGITQVLTERGGAIDVDEQRRYLGLIEQGGWQLLELVDDVLDLSRIEAGGMPLALEPVALLPLLQEAADGAAGQAQRHSVQLTLALPPGPALVRADPQRLRQVLANLVSNGIKYNRAGGSVTLRVQELPVAWRVEVVDTGPGMTAEQQAQLFQPFNRLGHANSAITGSGLGLVLVRWFVETMGGRIDIDSRAGEGTTAAVELPRA